VEHGPGGRLAGIDELGNKYYEKLEAQAGRHRWVVYARAEHWRESQDPTTVPPEWHAWLHHISDANPANADMGPRPAYEAQAVAHPTGTPACYQPKGAWENPHRRHWRKYEAWLPQQGR
jgi:NADH dehydrogenase (ubiquinone) 1 alpha subcomplex subunit 12